MASVKVTLRRIPYTDSYLSEGTWSSTTPKFSLPQTAKGTGGRTVLRPGLFEERHEFPSRVLSQPTVVGESQQHPIKSAQLVSRLQTMELKSAGLIKVPNFK